MRILYLCPDPGVPVLGRKGAAVHVRELVNAFARAGHRVTLAAQALMKLPGQKPATVRARVLHIPPDSTATGAVADFKTFNQLIGAQNSLPGELRRILYNLSFYRALKRRFLSHRPDFIYERGSLYATAGARLAARFKVPHIVELNAPLAVEQAAYRATGFSGLAAQAERWTLARADAVIVVSSELRKHVLSLGIRPNRVHVVPNGVDAELFRPLDDERNGNGPASRLVRPTLGFVGGLRPWHGVDVLPRLLARLSRRHPGIRLMIVGDGQMRPELEREFRRRGLSRRVKFTGALLHEEVPAMIRRFDIALAPYPRHDHDFYFSPLKLFEYMACGISVVASNAGQIAEVVTDNKTGLLYPPGNFNALVAQCDRLLGDVRLRDSIGTAAAKWVRGKFTWDRNADKVIRLAQQLSGKRS